MSSPLPPVISPVPASPSNSTNTTSLSPPPPPPPTPSAPSPGGLPRGAFAALMSGVGIGGFSVLLAVAIFFVIYRKKKKKKELDQLLNTAPSHGQNDDRPKPPILTGVSLNSETSIDMSLGSSQGTMTYDELAAATNNFSNDNLIGQGGYGYVHKGVLSNGTVVAVKQLKAGSGQGEREFRAEVEIITHVHHRHLVSLIGYCVAGAHRLLVYEFVPNNTLEFHLHGKDRPTMTWPIRMKIALGSARGLAYLHEDCKPKIIHRDIKASNILLDMDFEAKVSDFGLAKYSLDTETHVSTRVMGTFGYLAPEYAASGKLTEKSDVFSFGVVLLELITGRRPVDRAKPFLDDSMVDWARPLLTQALEEGDFDILVDPMLNKGYDKDEMTRMIACAAACIMHSARLRPKMSQVVRALEGNLPLAELNREAPPGHRSTFNSHAIPDYDTAQYNEDMEKFRKLALDSGSQDEATSEYSVIISGDGTGPFTSSSGGPHDTRES